MSLNNCDPLPPMICGPSWEWEWSSPPISTSQDGRVGAPREESGRMRMRRQEQIISDSCNINCINGLSENLKKKNMGGWALPGWRVGG